MNWINSFILTYLIGKCGKKYLLNKSKTNWISVTEAGWIHYSISISEEFAPADEWSLAHNFKKVCYFENCVPTMELKISDWLPKSAMPFHPFVYHFSVASEWIPKILIKNWKSMHRVSTNKIGEFNQKFITLYFCFYFFLISLSRSHFPFIYFFIPFSYSI